MVDTAGMATTTLQTSPQASFSWPRWPFELILWTLFLGPLVSPLFRATGLPLVADSGLLARELLATYICPTPERSPLLLGLPMGVCLRCWGATIGLLAARWLVARQLAGAPTRTHIGAALSRFRGLPWGLRLLLCALPFLLWPLEIVGHYGGLWYAPLWLLLLNGAQAGFAAGLLFCSLWPGLWSIRHRT
jgi:hypothetical protein